MVNWKRVLFHLSSLSIYYGIIFGSILFPLVVLIIYLPFINKDEYIYYFYNIIFYLLITIVGTFIGIFTWYISFFFLPGALYPGLLILGILVALHVTYVIYFIIKDCSIGTRSTCNRYLPVLAGVTILIISFILVYVTNNYYWESADTIGGSIEPYYFLIKAFITLGVFLFYIRGILDYIINDNFIYIKYMFRFVVGPVFIILLYFESVYQIIFFHGVDIIIYHINKIL